jgi:16S rRNA (adenine1518-N6/adenine1519-N6)-dimethyltransferase
MKKNIQKTFVEELLQQYGLSPNKILGQNFLVDELVLENIVEAADIHSGDFVIEIGPGIGNLTRKLLEKGAKVFAIEKDRGFSPILNALAKEFEGKLYIEWGDALKISNYKLQIANWMQGQPLSASGHSHLTRGESRPRFPSGYKVIGNIPYYITGKLVPLLLNLESKPESITLLVQKEVAERMTAKAGDMSLLSLAVQMKSVPEMKFKVLARSFYPMPKVDSSVVRLQISNVKFPISKQIQNPKLKNLNVNSSSVQEITAEEEGKIFKLAKAAFLGKRKTLLNSLSSNLGLSKEVVEKALISCKIDVKARPQELYIEKWLYLTKVLDL